ncbi:hypothetical protein NKG05_09325 [Oerskovia sp. M15]
MKVFRQDGSLPLDDETDRYQDEANALTVDDVITLDLAIARKAGLVVDKVLTEPYVDAIEKIVDVDAVRGSDLRVIVDPMYGTSQLTLGTILNDMRVRSEFIHASHNPCSAASPRPRPAAPVHPDLDDQAGRRPVRPGHGHGRRLRPHRHRRRDRRVHLDQRPPAPPLLVPAPGPGRRVASCATSRRRTCSTGWLRTSARSPAR